MAYVDSHTEGEPTRVIHAGTPSLGESSPRERIERLAREHPRLRSMIVDEPRGHAALVAALLLPPRDPSADHQVLFFNNVGALPMCVHASIGVARTLVHLGLRPASPWSTPLWLETPAGRVGVRLGAGGVIAVENVPAYRAHADLAITTSFGRLAVDVAWGGNWFAILESPLPIEAERGPALVELCRAIRAAPELVGITPDGAAIDHVQLVGPAQRPDTDAINFVLCPGDAWDRSPCGTGTSARMACLHAEGRLAPGQLWRQGSFTGSRFVGRIAIDEHERVIPTIEGRAWITGEGRLLLEPGDPLTP
ncbi:proline racemase family protein [Nannocystaceae bacterium ST9]